MKIPRDQSFINKSAKKLYGYYSGFFSKVAINLIVLTPPALVGTVYSNKDVKSYLRSLLGDDHYGFIAEMGRNHVLLFNVSSFVWPILLVTLGSEISRRAKESGVNAGGLITLLKALDSIVGVKNKRFHNHLKKVDSITKETAFEKITDPQAQIAEIVREIGVYFNAVGVKKDALIRVTLAVVEGDKVKEIPIFYPNDEPVKSSIASLNNESSGFLTAIRTKKTVLVSDIKKELKKTADKRKFVATENEEDNSGSIICYPVKAYDQTIPFVISVHSDEDGYFQEDLKDVYEHSLQRFALRLSVEYSLLKMKERLCV